MNKKLIILKLAQFIGSVMFIWLIREQTLVSYYKEADKFIPAQSFLQGDNNIYLNQPFFNLTLGSIEGLFFAGALAGIIAIYGGLALLNIYEEVKKGKQIE